MRMTTYPIGQEVSAMLRMYRARGRMSQAELAERMTESGFRWTQAKVSHIERDASTLRVVEALALAKIFNIGLDELVR